MKTVWKTRLLSILVCMILLVSCFPFACFAEGGASVSVGNASGKAGEEVTVNVNLADNPGLVAMTLDVNYDADKLELVSANDAGILKGFSSPSAADSNGSYRLNWEDGLATANNTGSGTVATLTFRLKENCDTASVNVSGSGYDFDVNQVGVSSGKGTITNTDPTTTTTTTKPTTTKPATTKPATTKPATTKPATTHAPYTNAQYTRSYNADNTYPVDFAAPMTEAESTTDLLDLWESTTEWTIEATTEETTTEPMTEEAQNSGRSLSKTKLILIVLMACFAIIGIAIIVSMVRKSQR